MWEVGLVMVVALIILGPRQLTEAARVVARLYREVQKLTWDIRNSIDLNEPLPSSKDKAVSTAGESSQPAGHDLDVTISQDKNTGPDFYADLLEASKEGEDEPEQSKDMPEQSAETQSSATEQHPKEGETKDIERT
jgi:Sec-independent protein translocase protein TatA